MTVPEIAQRLIEYCRKAAWEPAQRELYADHAASYEPEETPMFPRETKGLPAIIEKGKKFDSMVETMHGVTVSEPIVTEGAFAVTMSLDVTMKGQGRMQMTEIAVYVVRDGKIVSEQFFF